VGSLLLGMSCHSYENNMLTSRKEIKSENDPLWSIEIKRQNVDVCKGFYEEVIFDANLSISVC
jgi:hypothetical protein